MFSLKDFHESASATTEKFRGKEVVLREVSSADRQLVIILVRNRHPMPKAPQVVDLTKGSMPIDNEDDPEYLANKRLWTHRIDVIDLAIALGYVTASGITKPDKPEGFIEWADQAFAELSALPDRELRPLLKKMDSFEEQNLKGNSSSPSPAAAAG